MGLSVSLSNALSGMHSSQAGLDVLSRNVSNAGTPGYHRQSMSVATGETGTTTYARTLSLERAFQSSLQSQYNNSVTGSSFTSVRAEYLDRLDTFFGVPGDATSLDTQYSNFENSLSALSTSPDDFATRAQVVATATSMAQTISRLSDAVQTLRRETEGQITDNVSRLNSALTSLADVNLKISDHGLDEASRVMLHDERDRLVADVAEIVDVQAQYRNDGTVALMTRSGLGLLDVKPSSFSFESAGQLSASSQFSLDSAENGVGTLTMVSASGTRLDLVAQGVLQSGSLGALVELRDKTLVDVQSQLDDIAASMALSLSTVETEGTAATSGLASGFEIDLSELQPGNSFTLNYTESSVDRTVRVVRVDDTSKLPMDFVDDKGVRVLGIDFSTSVASAAVDIQAALGVGLAVTNPAGDTLRILDDGAAGTTDVSSMVARTTVSANQGAGLGLNLFVDSSNAAFTDSLDGNTQRLGFASRIAVNSQITNDNKLLVQYQSGGSLGDASRANFLLDQLQDSSFTTNPLKSEAQGRFKMSGNVQELISQTLNYQGGVIARAQSEQESQALGLDTLTLRMDSAYGVDIDQEMARLLEFQNAYAANARVISIVQELLQALMQI